MCTVTHTNGYKCRKIFWQEYTNWHERASPARIILRAQKRHKWAQNGLLCQDHWATRFTTHKSVLNIDVIVKKMRNCANQYKIWPVMYDQPLQIEDLMWEIGKMVWINGNLTYEWAAGGVLCVATAGKRPSASFLKPLHCNVFHFHYIVFNYITFNACHFISLSILTLHCVSFHFSFCLLHCA